VPRAQDVQERPQWVGMHRHPNAGRFLQAGTNGVGPTLRVNERVFKKIVSLVQKR
jgi:hypothetical protein